MIKIKYLALVLSNKSRTELLELVPTLFSNVVAHHMTINPDLSKTQDGGEFVLSYLRNTCSPTAKVISYACGEGVDAVMCKFEGEEWREDGNKYHVTLSLKPGMQASASNRLRGEVMRFPGQFELTGEFQILERNDDTGESS